MKRYIISDAQHENVNDKMIEDPDGEWVKYRDVHESFYYWFAEYAYPEEDGSWQDHMKRAFIAGRASK